MKNLIYFFGMLIATIVGFTLLCYAPMLLHTFGVFCGLVGLISPFMIAFYFGSLVNPNESI